MLFDSGMGADDPMTHSVFLHSHLNLLTPFDVILLCSCLAVAAAACVVPVFAFIRVHTLENVCRLIYR